MQLQTSKWFSQKPTRKVGVEGYLCDINLIVKVWAGCGFSLFAKSNIIISLQIIPAASVTSIVDGLKKLYLEKLKPLEVAYRFHDFALPMLVCSYP